MKNLLLLTRVFLLVLLAGSPAFGAYAQYTAISRTNSGTPLANYTVTVYVVLSNAIAATYSDNVGTVKPNPFQTDVNGAYSFWVNGDGLYFIGVTPTSNYAGGYYDARYFSVSGSTVTPLLVPGYRGGVGTSWYSGVGAPSSALGVDADFYLDTGTGNIYAKQGGSWGSPIMTLSGGGGGGGGGSGTVTSVAVALDATLPWLSLSGTNPITDFGTITLASASGQVSHRVIGTCGSATTFGVCQESAADISGLAASATTDATNATNITSGTLADARLGAYSGVGACGTNLWVSTLVRDGSPTCTQPGFPNLSGNPTAAQLGSGTASGTTFLRGDLTWQGAGGFPTFNQSTTGTAANVTGIVATANGGLGANNGSATGVPVFSSGTATVTTPTGTGSPVLATSPTLTTPSFSGAIGSNFDLGTQADLYEIANAGTTGTTVNKLAKLSGAPSTAVILTTSDLTGIAGVVVAGAGTTGNAQLARAGRASCVFDGATTANDYVQASATAAGSCHDTGSSTLPTSNQILGRVLSTNGGAGTYAMTIYSPGINGSGSGGSPGGSTGQIQYNNSGSFAGSPTTVDSSGNINGPAGGIAVTGGSGASDNLTLIGTSNGTRGYAIVDHSTLRVMVRSDTPNGRAIDIFNTSNALEMYADSEGTWHAYGAGAHFEVDTSGQGFVASTNAVYYGTAGGSRMVVDPSGAETGLWFYSGSTLVASSPTSAAFQVLAFLGESLGASVASASTITPTGSIFHVTGIAAITTISVPYTGFTGCLHIIPDGLSSLVTGGNIALASTLVISKVNTLCFDGSQWYPTY